jgi:alginate O-acetyltransferase complex protein AlgI
MASQSVSAEGQARRSSGPHIPFRRGWLPLAVLPATVTALVPSAWPRWAYMWALALAIFAGCKWLTWRRALVAGVPWWRHAGYLLAWPGLDAATFLGGRLVAAPAPSEWAGAIAKDVLGVVLFWGIARWAFADAPLLAGWIGMIGIVLMLHFGAFHVLSCAWRWLGVDARPLMNRPLASASVSEFWGRRWNTAFRDLTHRFLFRPLHPWVGARGAIVAGFLISGLIHEAVISLPARGGYGLPTLFFLLQAAAMLAERSHFGKQLGLAQGWRGRLFTMAVLIAPAGCLFHSPFVMRVIVPFMNAFGAL